MYSKQSASFLRKQFWTSFGQYLAPISSASGDKINWINYKTGIRVIHFKMDVVETHAYIGIEISHGDTATRELYLKHFRTLRQDIEEALAEEWIWEEHVQVNGKSISRISKTLHPVNIYHQTDWPQIISFLKARIIGLDRFWTGHKEIFEMIG